MWSRDRGRRPEGIRTPMCLVCLIGWHPFSRRWVLRQRWGRQHSTVVSCEEETRGPTGTRFSLCYRPFAVLVVLHRRIGPCDPGALEGTPPSGQGAWRTAFGGGKTQCGKQPWCGRCRHEDFGEGVKLEEESGERSYLDEETEREQQNQTWTWRCMDNLIVFIYFYFFPCSPTVSFVFVIVNCMCEFYLLFLTDCLSVTHLTTMILIYLQCRYTRRICA